MGNESKYSMGKNLVKQNTTFCQIEGFAGPAQVGLTHEILVKNIV